MRRILIIKLGALGDFIHAFHGFAAIRAAHPGDEITLLTTRPYEAIARAAPWFDRVVLDARAPWWNLRATRRTIRTIRAHDFVYDLQTARRTDRYFALAGRPPWSGVAPGCSHPQTNPERDRMHTVERQRDQLQAAGITHFPEPERAWLVAAGQRHGLTSPYTLLIPGGSGLGAVKQWPVERYAAVAQRLAARGVAPVILGTQPEAEKARAIGAACPAVVNLVGRTSVPDIAALAAAAALALGNDTGPLHLACSVGAPTLALYSGATTPSQSAPRGPRGEWSTVLQADTLDRLSVDEVMQAVEWMLVPAAPPSPNPPPEAGRTTRQLAAR